MSDENQNDIPSAPLAAIEPIIGIKNQAVLDQMQEELTALMQAWCDRGITPSDCAQVVAATGHVMLAVGGFSLAGLITQAARQWDRHGGKS